jgi:hypothetical protein
MNLTAPCRDCGTPWSYVCASCSTHNNPTDRPVCIHCCPNQEERQRSKSGWDCETTRK